MSVPTNTYQTFTSIGLREDLIDIITNIAPVDTYVTNNTGNVKAKGVLHEWQDDTLADAAANKRVEGNDPAAVTIVPTNRRNNYIQTLGKTFQITDVQEAVDKAGANREESYQSVKHLKVLAKDIEYALVINATSASGASATARQLKGMLGWITTNVTTGTGTGDEALTETMFNDALQLVWDQGGDIATVLCGTFQKRAISAFTGSSNTKNVDAEKKKLVNSIMVYESDFGDVQLRLHRILNKNQSSQMIILGDMDLWKKAWLMPVKRELLARTGPSKKYNIEATLTLESREERGSGKITQLTTS